MPVQIDEKQCFPFCCEDEPLFGKATPVLSLSFLHLSEFVLRSHVEFQGR